jgi:hypothetical protein
VLFIRRRRHFHLITDVLSRAFSPRGLTYTSSIRSIGQPNRSKYSPKSSHSSRIPHIMMSSSASTPQYEEQVVGSLESLVNRLNGELIEWPEGRNSYFLPIDIIGTIKDQELLHGVLKELFPHMTGPKLNHYVDSISRDVTKIFGFLLCRSSWKDCGKVIVKLIDENISDTDLPFSRVHAHSTNTGSSNSQSMASSAYTLGRSSCPCDHHKKCGIKAFSRWKRMEMENLCRDQWITLAPVFENLAHYNFEDNVILPFINDRERFPEEIKKGGYSEVWATRIHPAHQKILQSTHPLVWSKSKTC